MTNYRTERIERLLQDLKREIEIGIFENEIDEQLTLHWCVPISRVIPDGGVFCRFETRPVPRHMLPFPDQGPRLKIIQGGLKR